MFNLLILFAVLGFLALIVRAPFPLAWGAVGGALLGNVIGGKGAKSAAQTAAQSQQQIAQQQFQEAVKYQQQQEAAARAAILQMTQNTNPFQQAAQQMHPYFGAAGADVSMFGPNAIAGGQATAPSGTPQFSAPLPPMQPPVQAPPPQTPPPQAGGWGGGISRFFNGGAPQR